MPTDLQRSAKTTTEATHAETKGTIIEVVTPIETKAVVNTVAETITGVDNPRKFEIFKNKKFILFCSDLRVIYTYFTL